MKNSWLVSVAALALACAPLGAMADDESYVVSAQGERTAVSGLVADAAGTISYTTASGAKLSWRAGQYKEAHIPKPAEVGAMEAAAAQNRHDDVLGAAGRAYAKNYQFLGWGGRIASLEAAAYMAKDNASSALASCDRGLGVQPRDSAMDGELYRIKVTALLKLKRDAEAQEVLKKMFTNADPKTAAYAFNTSASMLAAQGKKREAVLDYMKTLLLCDPREAPEARETAKEAVKALLRELKDPRANEIDKL